MCISRFRALAVAALTGLLVVCACAQEQARQAPAASTTAAPSPSPVTPPSPDGLATSFAALADALSAEVGVHVAAIGDAGEITLGSWSTGVAWSTIKVPLAIAYLRTTGRHSDPLVSAAIGQSDNGAAEQMWSVLGGSQQAASAVDQVLRETGDIETLVQPERIRPGFTPFGQTVWPLAHQAQFAARLPCLDRGPELMDQMRNVAGNQQWGLAADDPVKGGWGPGENGGYLVRQLAVIQTESGHMGVALAAEPDDGSFDTGVAALNSMAGWLMEHIDELPRGTC